MADVRRQNSTECRPAERHIGIVEVSVIRQIESFSTELERLAITDHETLHERKIDIFVRGTLNDVTPCVAVRPCRGQSERGCIEPLAGSSLAMQIRIANQVGPLVVCADVRAIRGKYRRQRIACLQSQYSADLPTSEDCLLDGASRIQVTPSGSERQFVGVAE